jgi:predicted DCC family thiol-disulfide oxidoreductase YuxK
MKNGWTGGQYSLFRAIFGLYLLVHLANLVPWGTELFSGEGVLPGAASPLLHLFPNILALYDAPPFVTCLLVLGAVASAFFAIGLHDRIAAVVVWYVWACLFGRNPLISNPGIPYVGWMLLAHAFQPGAPYGSFTRRGQVDPGASWRKPEALQLVAWILMAAGYSFSGYTKLVSPSWMNGTAIALVLESPLARPGLLRDALAALPSGLLTAATGAVLGLELFFAPLALIRRVRPYLWGALLLMHISLVAVIDFVDLSLGMVMLHLYTFDPAWIRARSASKPGTLFYDRKRGLRDPLVRFVLSEDRGGVAFRFAPFGGATFRSFVPEARQPALSQGVVLLRDDGAILQGAQAMRLLLLHLGGVWRLLAQASRIVPDAGLGMLIRLLTRPHPTDVEAGRDRETTLPADLAVRFEA